MRVRTGLLLVAAAAVSCSTADAVGCRARFRTTPSWTSSSQGGEGVLHSSAMRAATLRVECVVMPGALNDQEFAAQIGEEEPDEAPPLRRFGSFRGRRWIGLDMNTTEWWLTRVRHLVHLTLMMKNQPIQETLAQEVEAMIQTPVVEEP